MVRFLCGRRWETLRGLLVGVVSTVMLVTCGGGLVFAGTSGGGSPGTGWNPLSLYQPCVVSNGGTGCYGYGLPTPYYLQEGNPNNPTYARGTQPNPPSTTEQALAGYQWVNTYQPDPNFGAAGYSFDPPPGYTTYEAYGQKLWTELSELGYYQEMQPVDFELGLSGVTTPVGVPPGKTDPVASQFSVFNQGAGVSATNTNPVIPAVPWYGNQEPTASGDGTKLVSPGDTIGQTFGRGAGALTIGSLAAGGGGAIGTEQSAIQDQAQAMAAAVAANPGDNSDGGFLHAAKTSVNTNNLVSVLEQSLPTVIWPSDAAEAELAAYDQCVADHGATFCQSFPAGQPWGPILARIAGTNGNPFGLVPPGTTPPPPMPQFFVQLLDTALFNHSPLVIQANETSGAAAYGYDPGATWWPTQTVNSIPGFLDTFVNPMIQDFGLEWTATQFLDTWAFPTDGGYFANQLSSAPAGAFASASTGEAWLDPLVVSFLNPDNFSSNAPASGSGGPPGGVSVLDLPYNPAFWRLTGGFAGGGAQPSGYGVAVQGQPVQIMAWTRQGQESYPGGPRPSSGSTPSSVTATMPDGTTVTLAQAGPETVSLPYLDKTYTVWKGTWTAPASVQPGKYKVTFTANWADPTTLSDYAYVIVVAPGKGTGSAPSGNEEFGQNFVGSASGTVTVPGVTGSPPGPCGGFGDVVIGKASNPAQDGIQFSWSEPSGAPGSAPAGPETFYANGYETGVPGPIAQLRSSKGWDQYRASAFAANTTQVGVDVSWNWRVDAWPFGSGVPNPQYEPAGGVPVQYRYTNLITAVVRWWLNLQVGITKSGQPICRVVGSGTFDVSGNQVSGGSTVTVAGTRFYVQP
ncbi:MAG: hypothetical protein M0031_01370 [Thermaerobacter sp.]|nr:hypothetical protein [Thermaerobacter sp.]